MKLIVEKNDLLTAALPSAGFASNKNTIASTEGILFSATNDNSCDLTAFDLEKGFQSSFSCKVIEQGAAVINSFRLLQILRSMPEGELVIEVDEKTYRAHISGGTVRFELGALNANEFPNLPDLTGENEITVSQGALKTVFQKTLVTIASDSPRPEFNGLNLIVADNTLTAVSCDGKRMALFSEKSDEMKPQREDNPFNIIVPGKTVSELLKFIDDSDEKVTVRLARKHVVFYVGGFTLFTRLIEATPLDYERFLPKSSKIFVTMDTRDFLTALERALLVTEDKQQGQIKSPVICKFEEGTLFLSCSSITGRFNDEFSVLQEGEPIEIGFDCRALCEAVRVCDCEKIKLSLTSSLMGMTIEPSEKEEGRSFLLLILPVRILSNH